MPTLQHRTGNTRTAKEVYGDFEMSDADHEELLNTLDGIEGRFLLSDSFAKKKKWKVHEQKIPNSAAGGKEKRIMVECVWTNY